jgi:hypothetical protein
MWRWTISLSLLVTLLATTSELEAQRRAPLRNLIRSFGVGWGTGQQWQNPGYDSSYYSPWSPRNTPQHSGQIIEGQDLSTTPQSDTIFTNDSNSATRLLDEQTSINRQHIIRNPHFQSETTSILGQPQQIIDPDRVNDYLRPYHAPKTRGTGIEIDHGGEFQIRPDQTPASNTGWDRTYQRQFENSQPFNPRK